MLLIPAIEGLVEGLYYTEPMKTKTHRTGTVYLIYSDNTDKVYVGSTYQNIVRRFAGHKSEAKRIKNGIAFSRTSSYDVMKYGNCYIKSLKVLYNKSLTEIRKCEQWYIDNTENCVNTEKAFKIGNEYHDLYNKNRHTLRVKCNICDVDYLYKNRKRHFNSVTHKGIIKQVKGYADRTEYFKKYNSKRRVKIECRCGVVYSVGAQARHFKTDRHKRYQKFQDEFDLIVKEDADDDNTDDSD